MVKIGRVEAVFAEGGQILVDVRSAALQVITLSTGTRDQLFAKPTHPPAGRASGRFGRHADIRKRKMRSGVVIHVARVGLAHDVQRLEQAPPALLRWHRVRLELVLDGARADRQAAEPAVRQDVQGGDVLSQPQRVIKGHEQQVGAQLETRRARGDRAQDMQRRGRPRVRRKVVLADPHKVQSETLGVHSVLDIARIDVCERLRLGRIVPNRQCHSHVHAVFLLSLRRATRPSGPRRCRRCCRRRRGRSAWPAPAGTGCRS